jgi:ornithine carbamoyltransferase
MAEYSAVPVINALSEDFHPCQLLADLQTFFEYRGNIQGARAAFVGDGSSNVCQSWINAAAMMNFELRVGAPEGYHPQGELVAAAGSRCQVTTSAQEAVSGVDLVITDTWTGMGQESEKRQRLDALSNFQVNLELMALASKDALFMHCLPAYRGQEVSAEVLEGPQSVVWDEAENRLHAQKALIELLMA